jgi:hypothetical protein
MIAFTFNLRHFTPFDDIEGQSNAVAANTLRLGSALMELSGDSIPAEITSTAGAYTRSLLSST